MKIITKKEQIIKGIYINAYSKDGKRKSLPQPSLAADFMFTWAISEFDQGNIIFELVSYPERRRISKEWVVANLDKIPGLKVWLEGDCFESIIAIDGDSIFNGNFHSYSYDDAVYIDPPHPAVEDVTPPWEVEKVEEEDPWVEISKDHVVKMPCEALFFHSLVSGINKPIAGTLISMSDDYNVIFESDSGAGWLYCKVRKSSIISSPLECPNYDDNPAEPDNTIKRLWWHGGEDGGRWLFTVAYTEKEFIEYVSHTRGFTHYAPGPIAPPESEWREVK